MFSLTISFGPQGTMWSLMFKTKETVEAAQAKLRKGIDPAYRTIGGANPSYVTLEDDFGQTADIHVAETKGFMLEDMEQSKLAHIERALHQARMQAKGQEMAEGDATLRAARARSGPAIIDPTGMRNNGGFPKIS